MRNVHRTRLRAVAVTLAGLLALGRVSMAAFTPTGLVSVTQWADVKVPISATDIAWDPTRSMILATISPAVAGYGNSLIEIDPATGVVGRQVTVGPSPGVIALAGDGTTAYVALQSTGAVVRVDLKSFAVVSSFVSNLPATTGGMSARDIAVIPGNAAAVAVAWQYRCCGKRFAGLAVYDNGVLRPSYIQSPAPTADSIGFGTSLRLYSYNNENNTFNFTTWDVDATGVHLYRDTPGLITGFGATILLSNQRLFTSYGAVIDPVQRNKMGTYSGKSDAVAPAFGNNRVYYVTAGVLNEFRADNYFPIANLALSSTGRATRLIATSRGLAAVFSTGELHLLGNGLVGGTSGPPPPIPDFVSGWVAMKLKYVTNAFVYDPTRRRILLSVAATSRTLANSVAEFDAGNGSLLRTRGFGYEPGLIAISDDGSSLYIAAKTSNSIERLDLSNFSINQSYTLGSTSYIATALAVAPQSPSTVAVVRSNIGSMTPNMGGLAVYDNGQPRPNVFVDTDPIDSISFRDSSSILAATRNGKNQGLRLLTLDSYGPTSTLQGDYLAGSDIAGFVGRSVLLRCGGLIDTTNLDVVGSYQTNTCNLAADNTSDRVYDYDGVSSTITEWQLSSYRFVKQRTLPTGSSAVRDIQTIANGVAIRTDINVTMLIPPPPPSTFSSSGFFVGEGDSGSRAMNFVVTMDHPSPLDLTLDWATTNAGTASPGTDFQVGSGRLDFPAGTTTASFTVLYYGDLLNEDDETLIVQVSNAPLGSLIDPNSVQLISTIQNDDARPTILPWLAGVTEGNSGTVQLDVPFYLVSPDYALTSPSGKPVTITYTTLDGSATAGSDYDATSGTIVVPPGATSGVIHITVHGDQNKEGDETLLVSLTSATNADIGGFLGLAFGVIGDDD